MARENRPCLTCNGPLPQGQDDFCTKKCKSAFHNRRAMRGSLVYDALMSAVETPGERTEGFAERVALKLREWHAEDEKAGLRRTTRSLYDIGYNLPRADVEVFKLKTE